MAKTLRTLRIEPELWDAAADKASAVGVSGVSEVIRQLLQGWVEAPTKGEEFDGKD